MQQYQPSAWGNASLWGLQAPQCPPFRFTDDSIIHVVVRLREPRTAGKAEMLYVFKTPIHIQDVTDISDLIDIQMPGSDYARDLEDG